MNDTLKKLIIKHADANGINRDEAILIYNQYQLRINQIVDSMELTDIKEIRVPFLMRFTFNEKKHEKYIENRDKRSVFIKQDT